MEFDDGRGRSQSLIRMKANTSLFFKIALVAIIALLMMIPLTMVKSLVRERQNYADGCRAEVSQSWGNAQTLSGPAIEFSYDREETDADGKKVVRHLKKRETLDFMRIGVC